MGVRLMSSLQLAARHYESGRFEEADAAWRSVIEDENTPALYRDLAVVLRSDALMTHLPSEALRPALQAVADNSGSPFWSQAAEDDGGLAPRRGR